MDSPNEKFQISEDELKSALRSSKSIRDVLKALGWGINQQNRQRLYTRLQELCGSSDRKQVLQYIKNPDVARNMFHTINTPAKAYWLGFLTADGSMKGDNLRLHLSRKDEHWIDEFARQMGLPLDRKKYYVDKRTGAESVFITWYVPSMAADLKKYGLVVGKEDRFRMPDIPKNMMSPFVLGYYDGDGIAGSSTVVGHNKAFLEDIKRVMNVASDVTLDTNPHGSVWQLYLGAEVMRELFASFADSMPRKRKTYHRGLILEGGYERKEAPATRPEKRKFEISREELQKLVKEKPVSEIARDLGVTDQAVHKRCRLLQVVKPPQGHWLRSNDNDSSRGAHRR